MITVEPKGSITLCHTPLEADYKNQLTFANATKQREYFESVAVNTFIGEDYTYIRKDNQIKIQKPIDDIINCNYLYYTNTGFTTKTYYCFITKMEYVNENTTLVTFQTDCFQTYQFDIVYNNCFVEREHVNDDTIGKNTIEEGLEVGEYINASNPTKELYQTTHFWMCMAVSELPDESVPQFSNHRNYNGIFSGMYYLILPSAEDCENAIKIYDIYSKADAIKNIFMVPYDLSCITAEGTKQWTLTHGGQTIQCYVIYPVAVPGAELYKTITLTKPTHVGTSYIPRNNKLYTFPYSYIDCNNNAGVSAIYRYEYFSNINSMQVDIISALCPGMSMKAIPLNYKGIANNYNESIGLGKLPFCSWSDDYYLNWVRQNGLNNTLQQLAGIVATSVGIASGNPLIASGGILAMFNANRKVTNAELTPNQTSGNMNCGDINLSYGGDGGLTYYYKTIKDEIARVIDDFFSMFGYKVNRVKIPNITGRTNWNYIKTIDCNFDGNIPQDDLKIIKSMFDNGVTMWHNPNTFYDYSQNNAII